nr:gustatory receptor 9 [Pieris rapae]
MMLSGNVTLRFSLSIFVTSLLDFVVMIIGPLFIELTLHEYDKLMSLITTELIQCKDRTYREQILTTLEYLEVRPPRFTVWRIVTVNLKLVATIVQLLVTYIIVLLSFQF